MKYNSDSNIAIAAGITVVIAGGLDMLGEPPAAWHPVVWYGKLIHLLEQAAPQRPLAQFLYGIAMLLLAAPITVLPTWGMHALAQRVQERLVHYPRLGILSSALLEGVSLKPFFALRMLAEAGGSVRHALEQGDLLAARYALRSLVSRDCSQLTAELVAAAAIESLAENLSDSVVAPLFYYLLFGVPGAATYRLFNTFDSMVGYHGRYEYLGKVAARLDDLLNFVPSRLTALLIIALAPIFDGNRQAAWRIWHRDARKTESPNAGHPMAATAGALGIQLEKVNHYILGDAKVQDTGSKQGPIGRNLAAQDVPGDRKGSSLQSTLQHLDAERSVSTRRGVDEGLAPSRPLRSPAPSRPLRSPAPSRPLRSPAPSRPLRSPASSRPLRSPVPHTHRTPKPMERGPRSGPAPTPTHLRQAEQMVWQIGVGMIALTAVLSMLKRNSKWSR